jgi:hypothetical protein
MASDLRRELQDRILRYMEDPAADSFDDLALAVFRRQFHDNPAYRKVLAARGVLESDTGAWQDIVAVSTTAFKYLKLHAEPSNIVFRTSGTTGGTSLRGEHHLSDAVLYRAALRRQFRRHVLPDRNTIRMLALTPSPGWSPDSSLGFMVADLMEVLGEPGSGFFLSPEGLELEALVKALREAEADRIPVALPGVVFGFVHLLEALRAAGLSFRMPPGSRIMDTGGFKGRSRAVDRKDLLRDYEEFLGIPPSHVINEYGMTELSSQFYDRPLAGGRAGLLVGPHWLRTRILDPETLEDSPPGKWGVLVHYDLANLDSVMAVETSDVGRFSEDGSEGFELRGRLQGADPRGWSIAVDTLLSRELSE